MRLDYFFIASLNSLIEINMNKIIKFALFAMLLVSFSSQGIVLGLENRDSFSVESEKGLKQKSGKISQVYQFSQGKRRIGFYLLEDGFTFYFVSKKKQEMPWSVGDQLVIRNPFEDYEDEEVVVKVENTTIGEFQWLNRVGWSHPELLAITSKRFERVDDELVVTIGLQDGTEWLFHYFDEKPIAKMWQIGDRVLLMADRHEEEPTNPFIEGFYSPHFTYEMINLDAKRPFPGTSPSLW